MAEGEHKQRVGKDVRELAGYEHISRKGVNKSRVTAALGGLHDELRGVDANLVDVSSPKGFPFRRGQALEPVGRP
jgi:hypothetical protein